MPLPNEQPVNTLDSGVTFVWYSFRHNRNAVEHGGQPVVKQINKLLILKICHFKMKFIYDEEIDIYCLGREKGNKMKTHLLFVYFLNLKEHHNKIQTADDYLYLIFLVFAIRIFQWPPPVMKIIKFIN